MIGYSRSRASPAVNPAMKPRLLVLTSTFPRWSNDTDPPFVYELCRRLSKHFEVTVHTPHYPGARTREVMDGISIHRFRYFFAPLEKLAGTTGILPTLRHQRWYLVLVPFFLVCQFCSLSFLTRKYRPALIHAHWLVPQGFFAALIGRISGTPIVVTAHGADVFGLQGKAWQWPKRIALQQATAVTVVSRKLGRGIKEIADCRDKLHVIPMGVDSRRFLPVTRQGNEDKRSDDKRQRQLLYVGRLTEKKGVRYLLEAMPLVLRRFPKARLRIIGGGELEQELKNQASALNLENEVYFSGRLANEQLPGCYTMAEVFIGPSIVADSGDTEGFGLTFVEAAMSGCLVIGTDTGGISEIIQDGETGLLAPPQDAVALAARIIYALEHDEEMAGIRENARQRAVEMFDWSVIASRYIELFQMVLKSGKG